MFGVIEEHEFPLWLDRSPVVADLVQCWSEEFEAREPFRAQKEAFLVDDSA